MKIHPLLTDPNAVLVVQNPISRIAQQSGAPGWEDFRAAGARALALAQVALEDEKAVIKPNVTAGERFADPDTGITTHPGFVQGMIEYLQAHGARRVTIAEDPRDSDDNEPRHWRDTGYPRVAQATGARLYCPTTYTCVKKPVPQPLTHPVLNVSRLAVDPGTALFNVPKLKTHNLGITTLCLKNLMGLVNVFDRHYCLQAWDEMPAFVHAETRPRREWFTRALHEQWQAGLGRRLADTAQVIRPALNLVEGIVGREGSGFQRGRNRVLGLAVAGVNPVAVDSLVSYLMGFDPLELIYLRLAAGVGLGENDVAKLRVYVEDGGEGAGAPRIVPCADIRSLRINPPFRVISNIVGEEPDPFHLDGSVSNDPSDSLFGKSKA